MNGHIGNAVRPSRAIAWVRRHPGITILTATLVVVIAFYLGFRHSEYFCNLRAGWYGAVPDTFEKYVIVGYDDKPFCPTPGQQATSRLVEPGKPITIWVRAVYRDAVNKGIDNVTVNLSLVDAFGGEVNASQPDFLLQPQSVTTGKNGFYFGSIVLVAQHQGHFRLRATYKDKNADGRSFGPIIIVQH